MVDKIKVSVCMITYNHEKYLRQALVSVLTQNTNYNYEIIIGDDVSNDGTREILKEYELKYPKLIKVIYRIENIGATRNLADCIKNSSGKYISILEGDDYWISDKKLQLQSDFLDSNLNFSTCFSACQMVDKNGNPITILPTFNFKKPRHTLLDLIEQDSFMATSTIMFRANLFDYFPEVFYSLRNGCDWTLNVLNAEHGDIAYIDELVSVYRSASGEDAWTSKPIYHIYKDAIKINLAFNKYFDHKYNTIFNNKITNYHYLISKDYLTYNKYIQSYKFVLKSFKYGINKKVLRQFFSILLVDTPKAALNYIRLKTRNRFPSLQKNYRKIKKHLIFQDKKNNKDWIATRIACLGQDVLKMAFDNKYQMFNIQKGRIDLIQSLAANINYSIKAESIRKYLTNDSLFPLIQQQNLNNWENNTPPKFFLIDSYSELTDQMFINRNNISRFCSNYSDLEHNDEFNNIFSENGLISNDILEDSYRIFFNFINLKFNTPPIIFIHFPVKLDNREKFKLRYKSILIAINNLKNEFDNLVSIEIDENVVNWPEYKISDLEKFPYHFNYNTYKYFAKQLYFIVNKFN